MYPSSSSDALTGLVLWLIIILLGNIDVEVPHILF